MAPASPSPGFQPKREDRHNTPLEGPGPRPCPAPPSEAENTVPPLLSDRLLGSAAPRYLGDCPLGQPVDRDEVGLHRAAIEGDEITGPAGGGAVAGRQGRQGEGDLLDRRPAPPRLHAGVEHDARRLADVATGSMAGLEGEVVRAVQPRGHEVEVQGPARPRQGKSTGIVGAAGGGDALTRADTHRDRRRSKMGRDDLLPYEGGDREEDGESHESRGDALTAGTAVGAGPGLLVGSAGGGRGEHRRLDRAQALQEARLARVTLVALGHELRPELTHRPGEIAQPGRRQLGDAACGVSLRA